jgi:nicotinamidase-related amidase
MRLPADATLIVAGRPDSAAEGAERAVATLIEAWRREDLPAFDLRGEAGGVFGGDLEARLDAVGATTLVMCGEADAVEASAGRAEALGFHVFIVRDACWPQAAATSNAPRRSAVVVDLGTALAAAGLAKSRQRLKDGRRAGPSDDRR